MKKLGSLIPLGGWVTFILLCGCFSENKISGTTSETTNGDIVATVTNAQGVAIAHARVLLVDDEKWLSKIAKGQSVILDSVRTNDKGEFILSIPLAKSCNIQIDNEEEGFFIRNVNTLADTHSNAPKHKFTLNKYGKLSGKVQSDSGIVQALRLAGTNYVTSINSEGNYAFAGTASGTFGLVAQVRFKDSLEPIMANPVKVTGGTSLTLQNYQVSANKILIDDFEQGWNQTALGRVLGDGYWYKVSDIKYRGNSSVTVSELSDSTAYAGNSVYAEYIMGTKITGPWSLMGLSIGKAYQGNVYDFSKVKAISFWAKGHGSVNVKFLSKTISRLYLDSTHFYYEVKLPAQWTHITIPVDSLRLPYNASPDLKSYTWQQVAKEMQTIDFTVEWPQVNLGDTVKLWIDDIYLEGSSLEVFSQ